MCGFTDVRKDKTGYYCSVCGWRPANSKQYWAEQGKNYQKQLDEQCKEPKCPPSPTSD